MYINFHNLHTLIYSLAQFWEIIGLNPYFFDTHQLKRKIGWIKKKEIELVYQFTQSTSFGFHKSDSLANLLLASNVGVRGGLWGASSRW